MRKKAFFAVLVVIVFLTKLTFAATYYVSELFGDDANDGLSELTPFANVQKAADVMNAGDKVIVDFGTYNETITPKNNGTKSNPIVYLAKEFGQAEITTGDTLMFPVFSQHDGNIYVAENVFRSIKSLTEDGTNLTKKDHVDSLSAGTWTQDRTANKLFVWSSDGLNPSSHVDTVCFTQRSFDMVDASYIVIEGFRIYNGIFAETGNDNESHPGLEIKNNVLGNDLLSSIGVDIDGGEVDTLNTYSDFVIGFNEFQNNAVINIRNAGQNSRITANVFLGDWTQTSRDPNKAANLALDGSIDYPGCQCRGLIIERNFFNNNNGHCFWWQFGDVDSVKIINNIFYYGYFLTWEATTGTNIDLINNTFYYNGKSHMTKLYSGMSGRVYNNLFAYITRHYSLYFENAEDSALLWEVDYNYWVTDTSISRGKRDDELFRIRVPVKTEVRGGEHAIYGHPFIPIPDTMATMWGDTVIYESIPDMGAPAYPLFVDPFPPAEDYLATPEGLSLVEESLAIDAGWADVAPADDYFGNLRDAKPDMGAVEFGVTGIDERLKDLIANDFKLKQNYPNPFNPETTIQYHLPLSTKISLSVYNVLGQKVATLYQGFQKAGTHNIRWKGMDGNGNPLPNGLYIYRLVAGDHSKSYKMMLLK